MAAQTQAIAETGRNLFTGENVRRKLGLSEVGYHFLGGVLAHQDRLYSIALRMLGDTRDAEEAAQDALVRAGRGGRRRRHRAPACSTSDGDTTGEAAGGSGTTTTSMPASLRCSGVIGPGAPVSGS